MAALPSSKSRIARVAFATGIVATTPFIRECSEGDGHVLADIGVGAHWATVHGMPSDFFLWIPDRFALESTPLWWLATVLAIAFSIAALLEWRGFFVRPFVFLVVAWGLAWLAVILPFPFLFFTFVGDPRGMTAMGALGLASELWKRRRAQRASGVVRS